MNYIYIGTTPPEEACFPVGHPLSLEETKIYKRQLEREFPAGIFRVLPCRHEFGIYYEVVAVYGDEYDVAANQAAFDAECGKGEWDEEALMERREMLK